MSGVADIAPYQRQRHAACADSDPLRAGARRIDRAQHRRAARRPVPRRPGAGAAPADHRPDRARRKLRLRHVVRRRQLQCPPDRLAAARARRGCRSARSAPAIDRQARRRAGARQRALQRAGARRPPRQARRCTSPRRAARSSASRSASATSGCGSASRPRRSSSTPRVSPGRSSAPTCAANSAAPRRRSAMSRCCSATPREPGCCVTATSASTAR